MAITLRQTSIDTGGKATELSYQQMNDNLKSFYYSSSFESNVMYFHFLSGSTSHSIDLSSFLDDTNTNIANTSLTLTGNRTLDLSTYDLTFDGLNGNNVTYAIESGGSFNISLDTSKLTIGGLDSPASSGSYYLSYNPSSGEVTYNTTSSISSNIYNTNGTLTAARTVTANSNNLTFDFGDADFTVQSGGNFGGRVYIQDLRAATGSSVMMIDPTNGAVSHLSTSSLASIFSSGGSPGGSDTYVQFNDGGSTFGGDSGFTYNKTANRVTITAPSSPTRTAPNLLLNSELGNVTVGEVLGVIASNNATDQYSPANYPASIQFTADTNFSPGNYDARIGLFVNNNATETEALRLKSSGQNQLPQYGSGTFTGTVAKYLAVDSSGNVIETDVATGANVTRPGSNDQDITFIEILANQQAAWNIQSTSGATPTSTNVTTDSATVSSITALKIHHTADTTGSFTGDVATALDQLAYGGTVQIGDTGEPTNTATATVRQVVDNGTYHTIYTSAWNSSGLTTLSGVFGLLIGFDTDKVVVLDDKNYNRIKVNNDCGSTIGLRFKANPSASPGDYYYVEVTADSANSDNMLFEYIHNTSGTGASYVEATNNIYYHNNAATLTQLNINSTYQQAVVEFRVTPGGNLALMGADKVLR